MLRGVQNVSIFFSQGQGGDITSPFFGYFSCLEKGGSLKVSSSSWRGGSSEVHVQDVHAVLFL